MHGFFLYWTKRTDTTYYLSQISSKLYWWNWSSTSPVTEQFHLLFSKSHTLWQRWEERFHSSRQIFASCRQSARFHDAAVVLNLNLLQVFSLNNNYVVQSNGRLPLFNLPKSEFLTIILRRSLNMLCLNAFQSWVTIAMLRMLLSINRPYLLKKRPKSMRGQAMKLAK